MKLGNVDIGFVGAAYEKMDLLKYQPEQKESKILPLCDSAQYRKELTEEMKKEKEIIDESLRRSGINLRVADYYLDYGNDVLRTLTVADVASTNAALYSYRNMIGRTDIFQNHSGQQWLAFSKCLYDRGFYEGMEKDEILEIESMLSKLTNSMDILNYHQKDLGSGQVQVTDILYGGVYASHDYDESAESLREKLNDALAGLEQFNQKYVAKQYQEAFRKVIEQFKAFNTKTINSYTPQEKKISEKCEMYMKVYNPSGQKGRVLPCVTEQNKDTSAT